MIEAMMQVLHIRDPETGDFKPLAAIKGDVGDKGNSAWIRFSANADGTGFTSTWTSGQQYIGFASAIAEPTDKSAYIWVDLAQIAKSLIVSATGQSDVLAMSQKKVTNMFSSMDTSISEVRRDTDYNANRISDMDTFIGNLAVTVGSLQSGLDSHAGHINTLAKAYGELNDRISSLESGANNNEN